MLKSKPTQAIESFHTKEYITFISQIGFAHPGQMKVIFNNPDAIDQVSPHLQAILITAKAKFTSLEGDFRLAQKYFAEAFVFAEKELKQNSDPSTKTSLAYVHYEYGLFLKLLYSKEQANTQFKQALDLTTTSKFKSLIEYELELYAVQSMAKLNTNRLVKMIDRFKTNNMLVMHILGLKRLGTLAKTQGDLEKADQLYANALELAEQNDLQYLIWSLKNSIGLLMHKQERSQEAVSYFESFIDSVVSHYTKSIVIKNLALRYYVVGRREEALELTKDGLEYAQDHGVFSIIPTYAFLLGDLLAESSNAPEEAFYYYKLGYDESMRQERAGLPLNGPRLKAVKKYSDYVTSHLPETFRKRAVVADFEWASNNYWIRIQDLFSYNLFVYHFIHTGIGKKTFKHLDMIPTTFYSLAKRMRDHRGIKFPDLKDADIDLPTDLYIEPLQKYIQRHREKTLKEVTVQFEHDIYEFLFKESGYNKKRLALSLDLSYAVVLKHTKQFTKASETFSKPS